MTSGTLLMLPGDPALQVRLRRSARARRISLRVSRIDGGITLTLPPCTPQRQGERFLAERADWVRAALSGVDEAVRVAPDMALPVEGRSITITRGTTRGIRLEGDRLILPPAGRPGALVANWLKLRARERILPEIERLAEMLGRAARRPPGSLRLADPRGRWGSCAASGNLMLSWRLMLAPPKVLDYVVAHEVAHLAQMNHSPAFWATVAHLMPDHAQHRTWLRTHGAGLHRYSFAE